MTRGLSATEQIETARGLLNRSLLSTYVADSGRTYYFGYLLQIISIVATALVNLVVPLELSATGYATFLRLAGIGFFASILVEQFFAAWIGVAIADRVAGTHWIAIAKGITVFGVTIALWAVLSRELIGGVIALCLALGVSGTGYLDGLLLSTRRLTAALIIRGAIAFGLVVSALVGRWAGPSGVAIGFGITYGLVGVPVVAWIALRSGPVSPRALFANLDVVGLAITMAALPVLTWLLPLTIVALHHDITGANFKFAMAIVIGAVAVLPSPPLTLMIAVTSGGIFFKALGRLTAWALIGTAAIVVAIYSYRDLLLALLNHRGYTDVANMLPPLTWSVFPLAVSPIMAVHLLRHTHTKLVPLAYASSYVAFLWLAVEAPSWLGIGVPVVAWAVLALLAALMRGEVIAALSDRFVFSALIAVVMSLAVFMLALNLRWVVNLRPIMAAMCFMVIFVSVIAAQHWLLSRASNVKEIKDASGYLPPSERGR